MLVLMLKGRVRLLVYRLTAFVNPFSRWTVRVLAIGAALGVLKFALFLKAGTQLPKGRLAELATLVNDPSFTSAIIALLASAPLSWAVSRLNHYLLSKTIRVNLHLPKEERFIQAYYAYLDRLRSEIQRRQPERFAKAWNRDLSNYAVELYPGMIPLEAIESSLDPQTSKLRSFERISSPLRFVYSEYLLDEVSRRHPLLLQGSPGSGKSTLIFELCRILSQHLRVHRVGWVPLLLFAHDFTWEMLEQAGTFEQFVINYFKGYVGKKEDSKNALYAELADQVQNLYLSTSFLIIIDGLDEITDTARYQRYAKRLNDLIQGEVASDRGVRNRYIVTCRTEDNQGHIRGHLFTLRALEFQVVYKHMQWQRKHERDEVRQQQLDRILTNLERARRSRLLQNYIENPFLFSIIQEYYEDKVDPAPKELREVFEHVLEKEVRRELNKPTEPHAAPPDAAQIDTVIRYIKTLMAPFCFGLTIAKAGAKSLGVAASEARDIQLFRKYLQDDPSLHGLIFGEGGYLAAYGEARTENAGLGKQRRSEDAYAKLRAKEALGARAQVFANFLDNHWVPGMSQRELEARANVFLYQDVKALAEACRIVYVDEETGAIRGFRHNRMREYFAALFIDKVNISIIRQLDVELSNAWLLEPLRIYGAITEHPVEFLKAYEARLDELSRTQDSAALSQEALYVLHSASEAVAYLPNKQPEPLARELLKFVHRFAALAMVPFLRRAEAGGARPSIMQCLAILRNLLASEFFLMAGALELTDKTLVRERRAAWREIHGNLLRLSSNYQRIAYEHLFPLTRVRTTVGFGRWQHSSTFSIPLFASEATTTVT